MHNLPGKGKRMKRIGFLVNPVAGIGGRVGLKGSDGANIQEKARRLGAVPEAAARAWHALQKASGLEDKVEFLTAPGIMGEEILKKTSFPYQVIGELKGPETTAEDTIRIAREIQEAEAELLLFAGGSGYRPASRSIRRYMPIMRGTQGKHWCFSAVRVKTVSKRQRLWTLMKKLSEMEKYRPNSMAT